MIAIVRHSVGHVVFIADFLADAIFVAIYCLCEAKTKVRSRSHETVIRSIDKKKDYYQAGIWKSTKPYFLYFECECSKLKMHFAIIAYNAKINS
ncbi:hypothetical protein H1P_2910009 [Hyella patelloides LEGE 07179]|uniref:Uncharacterized protein n=1 Tax=Hyella patelloides LEGE 07179 TaxID=945734 RepID=A0A563VTW4_9CYAN|nr:hypothetical protein H1P_2910009 [Hyella patelloides LEGE 07179]